MGMRQDLHTMPKIAITHDISIAITMVKSSHQSPSFVSSFRAIRRRMTAMKLRHMSVVEEATIMPCLLAYISSEPMVIDELS